MNSQNTLTDLKAPNENIICTMEDVRGDFLGPLHGTTPAAVIINKIKLRSFNSSEHINEEGDGPYRGFGYLSLFSCFSDPLRFGNMEPKGITVILHPSTG